MTADDLGGRPTMRDVVDLVNSTRQELSESMTSLANKFDAFVTSNEHRLTVVEMHQAVQAKQMTETLERLDLHGRDIGSLKDQQTKDEAAATALSQASQSRWSAREKLFAALCSGLLAAGGTLALVLH